MLVEILLFGSMAANLVVFVIIQRRIFKKSFQCLYYIQSLDSCFTCIASFDLLSVSLISKYFIDTSNALLCSLMFFGNAIVPVTFPIYNFSTAYIRYLSISQFNQSLCLICVVLRCCCRYENINRSLTGQRWRKNAEFKKYIHFTTSGCIIYTLGMVLANWLFEAEMSLLYSVCMNTRQAPQRPYLLGIFLGLPMMFILLLTIQIDWKCHQSAKKFRRQNLQKQCLPDGGIIRTDKNMDFLKFLGQEAPMRSTIINVVTIVFCVLITSLLLFMQDQMDMILTSLALFYGLKSPFSYIWSTRVSKSNLWKLRNIGNNRQFLTYVLK